MVNLGSCEKNRVRLQREISRHYVDNELLISVGRGGS
jgi:hypothetical protein